MTFPRHIILQLLKVNYKKRILKADSKKNPTVNYIDTPIRLAADFSAETL